MYNLKLAAAGILALLLSSSALAAPPDVITIDDCAAKKSERDCARLASACATSVRVTSPT